KADCNKARQSHFCLSTRYCRRCISFQQRRQSEEAVCLGGERRAKIAIPLSSDAFAPPHTWRPARGRLAAAGCGGRRGRGGAARGGGMRRPARSRRGSEVAEAGEVVEAEMGPNRAVRRSCCWSHRRRAEVGEEKKVAAGKGRPRAQSAALLLPRWKERLRRSSPRAPPPSSSLPPPDPSRHRAAQSLQPLLPSTEERLLPPLLDPAASLAQPGPSHSRRR
ncbi:unnamed protein product, partial [Urochloa humidicola]